MHLVFGAYTLDVDKRELHCAGEVVPLEPKAFNVLVHLMTNCHRAVSKTELLETLWPDAYVTEAALTRSIRLVRQAVGDAGNRQRVIKTLRGYGYRFMAEMTVRPAESIRETTAEQVPIHALEEHVSEASSPQIGASLESVPEAPASREKRSTAATQTQPAAERRQLTVLSCELVDAAALMVALDPEDLHVWMHECHATCDAILEPFDGFVAYRTEQSMVVYFGYPQAHEDDALRAVRAGLALVAIMPTMTIENASLSVRIGIHTGTVVTDSLAQAGRVEPLAIGAAPTIARRLRERGEPNTVVVSETTAHLVQGYVEWRRLEPPLAVSPTQGLSVYRVLGTSSAQTRLDVGALQGLTPFVGREAERLALQERWVQVKEGMGQVVVLRGEAGIGKSRLVQVLKDHVAEASHTCLECRSSPSYQNTALYPMTDLLQRLLGWQHDETPEEKLDTLEQWMRPYRLPFDTSIPLMADLLSLPISEARYPPLDLSPQDRRHKTLEMLLIIMMAWLEHQPVLLILEDLHWTDPTTLELLELLIEQTPMASLYLLVTCRPEFQSPWSHRSYLAEVAVSRLSPPQVENMAEQVAGGRHLPDDVLQHIVEKTDGVPLFVEEMTKAVLESGVLKDAHGQYEIVGPLASLAIPATLQDSLMARLDRLDAAKAVAQSAAVIGRQFSYPLLQAILQLDEETLQEALSRLVQAELLYQRGLPPQSTYHFKHAMTHEVAYGSLLQERKRALHARIVEALETFSGDPLAEPVEQLAHHAFQGNVWDKALKYYRQAGDEALAHSAHREAMFCFEQALHALEQLPASRKTQEQAIDLRFTLRSALFPLGEHERIVEHLRTAEILAEALDDQHRLGRVASYMSYHYWFLGKPANAIPFGERALAFGDVPLQVTTNTHLGMAYYALGNYRSAMTFFERSVASPEGDLIWERSYSAVLPAVLARSYVAGCLAQLGAFVEGLSSAEEGIRIAEAANHPFSVIIAYWGVGDLHLHQGDFLKAISMLERGLALCQTAHVPHMFPRVASLLGYAYALSGRLAEALPLLEQAVERDVSMRMMAFHPLFLVRLSEAYRLAGRTEDATRTTRRALDLVQATTLRGYEAWALRLLGDLALRDTPLGIDQAETHYQQALTLADELGMRPLQAHCHRGLGILYCQTRQAEQARVELSIAIEMYRDMEMTFWLPETEAALTQVG